jgi:hypothetical protein
MSETSKAEALRLAEWLESDYYDDVRVTAAAAELRRLHAEVAAMNKRYDEIHKWYDVVLERAENAEAEVERLRADRLSDINLHVMVLGQLFGMIDEGLINDAINLCAAAAKTCAQDIAEIEAASAKEKACKP